MVEISSEQLVDCLLGEWAGYIESFRRMEASAQVEFLEKQGYTRFEDLLAHIVGWWEEMLEIITAIMDGELMPLREYDVDAFNKAVIEEYRDWQAEDLYLHYENLRKALLNLVADLPEGGLDNKRIAGWLHACVLEHAHEHRLPG